MTTTCSMNDLRVRASLGLDWEPGKVLSRRCLRGIAPLHGSGDATGGGRCR